MTIVNGVLGLAIPTAILLGQVAWDRFAAISLGQIAVHARDGPLTPSAVQELLADALGDSTVALGLWDGVSAYVDVDGEPVELPIDPQVRAVTRVSRHGRPVVALIHDPMLDTDSTLIEGLAASSLMMLENARLVAELHASRARLTEAGDRERRKLERDLHDGAQQRLMAIQIKLRLMEERIGDRELAAQLDAIGDEAAASVEELRALARGIYPPALRQFGLVDALRAFAMTAQVPIEIVDDGIGRCAPTAETAIYFCVMEAVQNVTKHAGGHARVTITLGRDQERVRFAVADDGVGMDPSAANGDGEGLTSMRDRIGAMSGELEITSTPGRGTTIRATVPDSSFQQAIDPARSPHERLTR